MENNTILFKIKSNKRRNEFHSNNIKIKKKKTELEFNSQSILFLSLQSCA